MGEHQGTETQVQAAAERWFAEKLWDVYAVVDGLHDRLRGFAEDWHAADGKQLSSEGRETLGQAIRTGYEEGYPMLHDHIAHLRERVLAQQAPEQRQTQERDQGMGY